jgi:hypothetical protein
VTLFNEVEQHDHVAEDHPDQAGDSCPFGKPA